MPAATKPDSARHRGRQASFAPASQSSRSSASFDPGDARSSQSTSRYGTCPPPTRAPRSAAAARAGLAGCLRTKLFLATRTAAARQPQGGFKAASRRLSRVTEDSVKQLECTCSGWSPETSASRCVICPLDMRATYTPPPPLLRERFDQHREIRPTERASTHAKGSTRAQSHPLWSHLVYLILLPLVALRELHLSKGRDMSN